MTIQNHNKETFIAVMGIIFSISSIFIYNVSSVTGLVLIKFMIAGFIGGLFALIASNIYNYYKKK